MAPALPAWPLTSIVPDRPVNDRLASTTSGNVAGPANVRAASMLIHGDAALTPHRQFGWVETVVVPLPPEALNGARVSTIEKVHGSPGGVPDVESLGAVGVV